MIIENVIGEILYIGLVAEKGRCYGRRWGRKYKRIIRIHNEQLMQIYSVLAEDADINSVLNDFIKICKNEYEIGKYYKVEKWKKVAKWEKSNIKNDIVISEMGNILYEIKNQVNKVIVNKKKIYKYFNYVHNLPKMFLIENQETLCNLHYKPITEEDAIKYVLLNNNKLEKNINN